MTSFRQLPERSPRAFFPDRVPLDVRRALLRIRRSCPRRLQSDSRASCVVHFPQDHKRPHSMRVLSSIQSMRGELRRPLLPSPLNVLLVRQCLRPTQAHPSTRHGGCDLLCQFQSQAQDRLSYSRPECFPAEALAEHPAHRAQLLVRLPDIRQSKIPRRSLAQRPSEMLPTEHLVQEGPAPFRESE